MSTRVCVLQERPARAGDEYGDPGAAADYRVEPRRPARPRPRQRSAPQGHRSRRALSAARFPGRRLRQLPLCS